MGCLTLKKCNLVEGDFLKELKHSEWRDILDVAIFRHDIIIEISIHWQMYIYFTTDSYSYDENTTL